MSTPVRGSPQNPYQIAVLAGDGAGPAAANAAKKVLNALAADADLHFEFRHAPYGAEAYTETGALVTDDTIRICREADAVLRSYQGTVRGAGCNGSGHIALRDQLALFAQFRPVLIYPQLANVSTLKSDVVSNVDIMLVREISAGALRDVSSGDEATMSEISYTREQVEAIAEATLAVAERRSGRIVNIDKADVMSVSRFWRRVLHESINSRKDDERIVLSDMFVDDFVREVIHKPARFDVVVTSNLFGDICAEVIDALAGPQRLSPSFWKSRDGLGVYGPADIYNFEAYPSVNGESAQANAIALTRAATMMLRYQLDEPAAANTIQQALRKTMADLKEDDRKKDSLRAMNGNGDASLSAEMSASEYADVIVRSMQLLRQFEQVCDPTECGE